MTAAIQSLKTPPGGSPVVGWRQDLDVGDVLVFSLTDNTGVSSYRWQLIGRPEGSTAGGAGPEPISLGSGATASLTVDSDSPYPRDGTYIVACTINEGAPSQQVLTVGCARLSGLTTADGRPLRMLGGYETFEDTSQPLVRQGYNMALERWFRYVAELTSGTNLGTIDFTSFRRNDLYQCAGVNQPAGPNDNNSHAESGGSGAASAAFEPYIIAYPEIMPADGTITSLGLFSEGVTAGYRAWVGCCATRLLAGNDEPGVVQATFEHASSGFDGELFRSGAVSISVTRNQKVWFVTQTNAANLVRGYRISSCFRPCLGEATTSPLTSSSSKGYIGLRSTAAAAYAVPSDGASLASLPTLLPVGNDTIGAGSAATINRPSIYFKFVAS